MFTHTKQFQYNAKPDNPDPIFAKQMQELLGGQWGEISVMITYLFQGWNCPGRPSTATCSSTPPPRRSATSR